jgi:hypothetical protein
VNIGGAIATRAIMADLREGRATVDGPAGLFGRAESSA